MTSAPRSIPAPGLVIAAVFSIQLGAGVAKGLFTSLPPSAVAFLRLAVAAVILLAFAAAALRRSLVTASRSDLVVAVGFGLALAVMNTAIYESISRIPLGVAVTIEFLGPLAVAVALSRNRLDLVWIALAGAGVALLTQGGAGRLDPAGVLFALLAAAGWAAYILLSAQTGRRFPKASGLAVASAVGAVAVAPMGIAVGGARLAQPDVLLTVAVVALLSSVIPYTLELEALRRMPATLFGILMSLGPAAAALVGLVVLREFLQPREWVAMACVVAACLGATRGQAGHAKTPAGG